MNSEININMNHFAIEIARDDLPEFEEAFNVELKKEITKFYEQACSWDKKPLGATRYLITVSFRDFIDLKKVVRFGQEFQSRIHKKERMI